ncbi:MAG: hypothetical protein ACKOK8_08020, partial [Planctomycetia bacterium]
GWLGELPSLVSSGQAIVSVQRPDGRSACRLRPVASWDTDSRAAMPSVADAVAADFKNCTENPTFGTTPVLVSVNLPPQRATPSLPPAEVVCRAEKR